MTAIFVPLFNIRITQSVFPTIFESVKNSQSLILKSSLGQINIKISSLWNIEKLTNYLTLINISTDLHEPHNLVKNKTLKNTCKHFVFQKKNKSILDKKKIIILKKDSSRNNINYPLISKTHLSLFISESTKSNKLIIGFNNICLKNSKTQNFDIKTIYMYNNMLKTNLLERIKFLEKKFNTLMLGVSQGYNTNLFLHGVGYNSKIIENQLKTKVISFEKNNFKPFTSGIKEYYKINKKLFKKKYVLSSILCNFFENFLKENYKKLKVNLYKSKINIKNDKKAVSKYLLLNLGFSHNILLPLLKEYALVNNVTSTNSIQTSERLGNNTYISVFGITKQQVNQTATNIYECKKPEPYKGKGIRYNNEKLFLKQSRKI